MAPCAGRPMASLTFSFPFVYALSPSGTSLLHAGVWGSSLLFPRVVSHFPPLCPRMCGRPVTTLCLQGQLAPSLARCWPVIYFICSDHSFLVCLPSGGVSPFSAFLQQACPFWDHSQFSMGQASFLKMPVGTSVCVTLIWKLTEDTRQWCWSECPHVAVALSPVSHCLCPAWFPNTHCAQSAVW